MSAQNKKQLNRSVIKSITFEQEAQIPKYIKKWVDLAFQPVDKKKAIQVVKDIYQEIKEKEPIVIIGNSPKNVYLLNILFFMLIKKENWKKCSQFDSQLHSQLDSQLRSQLDSQLHSQLDQLHSQLDSQLDSQLYSQLYSQLHSQLYSQLDSQLYSQLDSQLYSQLEYFYLSYWYYDWAGYYDYAQYIGVQFDKKKFDLFQNYLIQVPFIIPFKNIAFISEKPQISWLNKKLHNEKDMAIKYPDNYGFYFLEGVNFKKDLWQKVVNKKLSAKEILNFKDIEQRMIAMKYKGIENMLQELNAKLLDNSQRGNELYLIENVFSQPAYFLKYKDKSTDRIYCKGIEPEIGKKKNADLAQASTFKWSLEQYQMLKIES